MQMFRVKKILLVTAISLVTVLTGCSQRAGDEFLEDTNDHADYEETEDLSENTNNYDRTDEEYIAVFLDNSEDFEYIAQIMSQWEKGYIQFYPNGSGYNEEIGVDKLFYTNNQGIADEIMNNEEFYNHLMSIRQLNEITTIRIVKDYDSIEFCFGKNPPNYRGSLFYAFGEEAEELGGPKVEIDDNWVLLVLPNI